MAFVEKFNLEFANLHRLDVWRIEIFEEGYAGGIIPIVGSGEPLIINWLESTLFEAIGASECTVELESITNFQFKEFLSAIPNQFLIKIRQNGILFWQGVNVTENNTEPYDDTPYSTKLKFTDGLGQLKYTEFEDGGLIDGTATIIDIIVFCLNKLPYQLKLIELINVTEDNLEPAPAGDSFLNTTFLDRQVFRKLNTSTQSFEGWNCLAVLREILHSIGATIYQSDNFWNIVRIEEYESGEIPFVQYLAGSTTVDIIGDRLPRRQIDNDAINGISWINRNADLNVSKVFDEIEYIYKFGSPDQEPGELISDSDFSISVTQIPDISQFDLWELGPGYTPGFSPRKFSVLGHDFYWNVPTTGIYYDTPSLQINPVFDSTKFLKSLEFDGANNTRNTLITTINDNAIITWDGYLEMELGQYKINGLIQFQQLNLPYEITFFLSVQIGINYLEEDIDGVLSWGTNANSVISIRKIFDLKKPLYTWLGPIVADTQSSTRVFRYGPIAIELPNWPSNDLSALNFKFFQPATPIIFPVLNDVGSAIQAITLQVTPLSLIYQPGNGRILSEVLASQFNTNVKDRKMTVTVLFGDGPHSVIKNSFLVDNGGQLESSDNWIKGSDVIDSFSVSSISANFALNGQAKYTGPVDHNFAVGQWIQGKDFADIRYNRFQQVVFISNSKTFTTTLAFVGTDAGILFTKNSHAETFILGPYGKFFSEYRDDLRGDLVGGFSFLNSFIADNGKLYFQRGASYRIKSNEATLQLIELDTNPLATPTITQYDGIRATAASTGTNSESDTPNTTTESAGSDVRHQPETHTENVNIQIKGTQIIKINQVKYNPDNFRNHPAQ